MSLALLPYLLCISGIFATVENVVEVLPAWPFFVVTRMTPAAAALP